MPVSVATVSAEDVPVQLACVGSVEAHSTVAIESQVTGPVMQIHFREGQAVKKGDPLFTIDPRPFEIALKQAQAQLAKDQAQANDAHSDLARKKGLMAQNAATQWEVDHAQYLAQVQDAVVQADQAAIDQARLDISYCTITSPLDGITGNIQLHVGGLAKANDVPVLVQINQVSPIYVAFTVPDRDVPRVRAQLVRGPLHIEARIRGDAGSPLAGAVTFLDNAVDTATGTLRLKATFPNQDHHLWPGQFVDVVLTLQTLPQQPVAPARAVQTGQQGQYVFVVGSDHRVAMRPVTSSLLVGNDAVIEGVKPGEVVVTDGHLRLQPGSLVEARTAASPAQGTKPASFSGRDTGALPGAEAAR